MTNTYHALYKEVMAEAPKCALEFSAPGLTDAERQRAVAWLRDPDNVKSPMALQIKFAFSIPTKEALHSLAAVSTPMHQVGQRPVSKAAHGQGQGQDQSKESIAQAQEPQSRPQSETRRQHALVSTWFSCGSGTGYWESLMRKVGLQVICFDSNKAYPAAMRFLEDIHTAGPELVAARSRVHDGLFLAWPDTSEESTFGLECLKSFKGNTVAHVGELRGETLSANPWGQSTSAQCQEYLTAHFRLIHRVDLPHWPYQRDSLTLWQRITHPPINCDGALFIALQK